MARLRAQARALSRIDATAGGRAAACCLEPWELELSDALSGHQATPLGVFATEAEAARAVDRALLQRDGLAAAPSLAFPLSDYIALLGALRCAGSKGLVREPAGAHRHAPHAPSSPLPPHRPTSHRRPPAASPADADQMAEALGAGLLPIGGVPQGFSGPAEGAPQHQPLDPAPPPALPLISTSAPALPEGDCGMAPPVPAIVPRKASVTPRLSAADPAAMAFFAPGPASGL